MVNRWNFGLNVPDGVDDCLSKFGAESIELNIASEITGGGGIGSGG